VPLAADERPRLVEAELVQAAILLRRSEHVGEPGAVAQFVAEQLLEWDAVGDAPRLDDARLIDEPLAGRRRLGLGGHVGGGDQRTETDQREESREAQHTAIRRAWRRIKQAQRSAVKRLALVSRH
jgi:hypothetical protein